MSCCIARIGGKHVARSRALSACAVVARTRQRDANGQAGDLLHLPCMYMFAGLQVGARSAVTTVPTI